MLKNMTMCCTVDSTVRRLRYGLSAIALALAFAGHGSLPADAQSGSAASTSGEFKIASHTLVHSVLQPNYQPPRKKSRRYARRKIRKPIATPAWFPKEELKDPIQVIVSLPEQKLTVYRGDKALVTSRLSSGKSGYSTPSGVFSILQKNRVHFSNIYRGAPMPYMQRLTWSGIAFHGSNSVPRNRPASHGCIRLPHGFASQLFKFTEKGAHVIVANEKAEPVEISHDNLFQPVSRPAKDPFVEIEAVESELASAQSDTEVAGVIRVAKVEEKEPSTSPLRVLVTRRKGKEVMVDVQKMLNELSFGAGDADGYMGPDTAQAIRRFQATYGLNKDGLVSDELIAMLYKVLEKGTPTNGHLYVRRDFNPVFDAPVVIKGGDRPLGAHLYTAMYFEEGASQTRWLAVTLKKGSGGNAAYGRSAGKKKKKAGDIVLTEAVPEPSTAEQALSRIEFPKDVRQRISEMLVPGSSLAITNDGISRETTPKGTDFIVLMQ